MGPQSQSLLCPLHAGWLRRQPELQSRYYTQTLACGQRYLERRRWSAALPYLGTARQIADIMLDTDRLAMDDAPSSYCTASVLLMLALRKLCLVKDAFEVYVQAIQTLEMLPDDCRELIADHLDALHCEATRATAFVSDTRGRALAH